MRKPKKTKYGDFEYVIRFHAFSEFKVHVIITDCIVKSAVARYPYADPSRFGTCLALTVRSECNATHMFFRMNTIYKPYEIAGNLAHEAWHAIRNMFKWAGVDDSPLDSETVAYHLGFTVERATKFFEEVRNDQCKRTNRRANKRK